MLKIITFFSIVTIIFSVTANADDKYLSLPTSEFNCVNHILFKDRAATVTDVSGEETALAKLVFKPDGRYYFRFGSFPQCGSSFYIVKDTVQLSIPINMLLSIKFDDATCEAKFKFMNEVKTVTGKYIKGKFKGEGDFGELNIQPKQVREILFEKPVPNIDPPELNAHLVLKNGHIIPVREADMKTIDLF